MLSPIDFFITPSCADQLLRRKLSYRKCSGPVSIVSRRISFCKRRMCPSRVAPGEPARQFAAAEAAPRRSASSGVAQKRSEERRVGKECRSRGSPDHQKKSKEYKRLGR